MDFWTAFLRGKDGWLQPLKLYATYSGVKQLSGKTRTMWNRSALLEVLCGYHSQPLCSELLWFTVSNSLQVKVQPDSLAYQAIFFQISTSQYSITVGCRFARCRIRWFQQSRDSLKGSGSSHVCQVSMDYKSFSAQPIIGLSDCSLLAADITDLTFKCDSIFQWLSIYGNVWCLKLGLLWHHACSQGGLSRLLHKIQISGWQGGNYPQQNLQYEVVSHGVFREAWEVILLMVQKVGDHHLGMYKTL